MLTNNDKRLHTDSIRWLLGNCKKGGGVNELQARPRQQQRQKRQE